MTANESDPVTEPEVVEEAAETPPQPEVAPHVAIADERARAVAATPARELTARSTFDLTTLSLPELWGLAKALAAAEVVPKDLRGKPNNVFVVLLKGAELNLSAMTAIAEVMVVEGKLVLSSHLQNALVQRSGKAKVFRICESNAERAVVEVQRHDWTEPTKIAFTMAEATALGLTTRGKDEWARKRNAWVTQPENMLRRRAITRAARECFGDVVIAYDPDEVEREEVPQPAPTLWTAPSAAPPPSSPAEAPATKPAQAKADRDELDEVFGSKDAAGGGVEDVERTERENANRNLSLFSIDVKKAKTRTELQAAWATYMEQYESLAAESPLAAEIIGKARPIYGKRMKELR